MKKKTTLTKMHIAPYWRCYRQKIKKQTFTGRLISA